MVAASEVQPQAQSGKSPNSKEASPSKATEASVVDPKQEAANVLAAGKRNLLVSDIPQAVEALGEACELFTKVYGETAPECAEAYFFYGKSLLEMARLENGVLGNALDGVPEDEDKAETSQVEDPEKLTEEEKVDVEEKVDEALVENFEKHDKSVQVAEDELDPSNLQLACEMLELAKVCVTLGEVSLEIEICLKKRMEAFAKDSRCIAETHYQLGIAQGFDIKWEAIKVLESRIENLKKETASPDEEKKDDAFHTQEKEIAEIEALIPEIKEKITDTNEMKAESLRKMKEAVGLPSGSGSSSFDASTSASTAKPIASIAVKRKAEDKDAESKVAESKDESSAKKSKEEASVVENGDAKVA